MTTMTTAPRAPSRTATPATAPVISMTMPERSSHGARVVFVAVNGYGKTTAGALGPDPVIVMSPDERGYETLYDHGLVPAVPLMRPRDWPELIASLRALASDQQGRRTVVLDALAGFEYMLAQHICRTQYGNDWGKGGFLAWNEGPRVVARTWPVLLGALQACAQRGLNVLILGHAKITRFNNPDGPDYDRYECACGTADLWSRTRDWAEAVLFGNFVAIVDQAREQPNIARAHGKAIGQQRVLRCQYSAAADAKNQYGLDPQYIMPDNPEQFADAFWRMVTRNKERTVARNKEKSQ